MPYWGVLIKEMTELSNLARGLFGKFQDSHQLLIITARVSIFLTENTSSYQSSLSNKKKTKAWV